ncbi:MAG: PepSY domain-containing protein [Clostridia bacterium]|nr:PepSY domain-containing protein [Clostridia bacterium]
MKKLFALILTLVFVLSLSACNSDKNMTLSGSDTTDTASAKITREEALDAALKHAELKKDGVHDIDIELEKERGTTVWDVDFETPEHEYSYEINTENGNVERFNKEIND